MPRRRDSRPYVYWIPLWAPSRQTEPTNSGKRHGAPPHVGGPHHAPSLDTGRVVDALLDDHGFLSRSFALFAPPVVFDDYEAVRVGGTGGIVCPCGPHLDAVQRRRTGTIVPTMAQNLSHEHEQKHPAQGLGSPSHEGDPSIWGLGPLLRLISQRARRRRRWEGTRKESSSSQLPSFPFSRPPTSGVPDSLAGGQAPRPGSPKSSSI